MLAFYGVEDPLRARLLELAEEATGRGWWDDYADAVHPQYLEFIGLEAEATSCSQWQSDVIPGLLQTADYARQLDAAFKAIAPNIPPSVHDRFLRVRSLRQERLTSEPALRLSVVVDEAVLLRRIGDNGIMRAQLAHLATMAEMPQIDLRILPLNQKGALVAASFVILSFGSRESPETAALGDVVSTESLNTELYVEGEAGTHLYRLFFDAASTAALPPEESRQLILTTLDRVWS